MTVNGVNGDGQSLSSIPGLIEQIRLERDELAERLRVRDARVEPPPDELVLAWADAFWMPTRGGWSPLGAPVRYWLPMPPPPEEKR